MMKRIIGYTCLFLFIGAFITCLFTGAPSVALGYIDLGIEGKFFYESHGIVKEITEKKYITCFYLFFSVIVIFALIVVISIVMIFFPQSRKLMLKGKESKGLTKKGKIIGYTLFGIWLVFVAVTIIRANIRAANYPNAPHGPQDIVHGVKTANDVYMEEKKHYGITAEELIKTGHLHLSFKDILGSGKPFSGCVFEYTSDGDYWDLVGRSAENPKSGFKVYANSNLHQTFYVISNIDLERFKKALIENKKMLE